MPWSGHIVLDGDPAPPPQKRGHIPQCSAHVYCGQTAGWFKIPLGTAVGLGRLCVRWDPVPLKGAQPPILGVCLLWPNGWMHHNSTWYGGRPRPRRYCLIGTLHPPPEKGHSPQCSAHVYCGQMAGWMMITLGVEVGLGPGHIVLDRIQVRLP